MKRLLLLLITMLLITGCKSEVKDDFSLEFKEEYESLNGLTVKDDTKYMDISIDKDNPIIYADYDKIFEILDGTGVIYLGFPQCPWCRNAVPIMLETAKEVGIDKIYYLNNKDDRDMKSLVDNNIVTEKEGTDDYYKLLEKLGEKASIYSGLNDDTIKRIYFPSVIFVKNGKIIDIHVATVDSQTDPYILLTDDQKEQLKEIYINDMEQILGTSCDINTAC